jgi:hypothetical protein
MLQDQHQLESITIPHLLAAYPTIEPVWLLHQLETLISSLLDEHRTPLDCYIHTGTSSQQRS